MLPDAVMAQIKRVLAFALDLRAEAEQPFQRNFFLDKPL